ncbi:hypothetical protein [Spirosoma flavum]|uniref:Uncharacterized protein n=1 Tax=Spirosoma flavum TaxID=2048557 RepID=A0ABW6AST7_9BACT
MTPNTASASVRIYVRNAVGIFNNVDAFSLIFQIADFLSGKLSLRPRRTSP